MLTPAAMLTTNATIASPLSRPLTVATATGADVFGFGADAAGAPPGRGTVGAGAGERAAGAPGAGRGAAGAGAGVGGLKVLGAPGAGAAPGAAAGDAAGPPAGRVGKRIVAVGLGGKLMRTVSFFGWTFAPSGGLGGPGGTFGLLSAIYLS